MTAQSPSTAATANRTASSTASSTASREARRGHLAMLAFSGLVAGSFTFGSRTANLIDPNAVTALRLPIAAVLLGAGVSLGLLEGRRRGAASDSPRPSLLSQLMFQPWRPLLLGVLMAFYFVMMFEGLKTAAPVSTAAVFTLTPLIAAGFGWVLMRQRLTPWMLAALGLGGIGALWVIFRGDLATLMRLEIGRGEMIYLAGCVAHALYAALVPRLNRGESAPVFSCATMTWASLAMLPFAAQALFSTDWAALPPLVWITIAYVAVAATAISTALVQYGALRLPASKVMAYTYLVPSWVILWEAAFGAGLPAPIVLVGMTMTCVALIMLLRDGPRRG